VENYRKFLRINSKKEGLDTLLEIWKTGSTDQRHQNTHGSNR